MPDEVPSEEYLARYTQASFSHGYLLAVLERMRRTSEEHGQETTAWTVAVLEHLLCALEFGSAEHMALHNVVATFVEQGLTYREPPAAAVTAFDVHAGEL